MAKRINKLLNAVIATGAGAGLSVVGGPNVRTYQAILTGTGTISATVKIQGSADNTNWVDIGSAIALSDATVLTGAVTATDAFAYVRANVTALAGTAATVNAYVVA